MVLPPLACSSVLFGQVRQAMEARDRWRKSMHAPRVDSLPISRLARSAAVLMAAEAEVDFYSALIVLRHNRLV